MSAVATPEVFISYARRDEPMAKRVADALKAQGHSVWRDDELPAHRAYAEVIEERLKSAKAVLVIWSAEAAKSQWVRAEADSAREARTLIQANIDGILPPMPFNQIECADLQNWDGDPDAPGWRKIQGSISALVGERSAVQEALSAKRLSDLSICVLPFANMSGDADQEYFSDGISEDITTDLSNISALSVVARNTAFTFKGSAVDVGQVVQKLGVSHVLEGSVRKAGQRVRITAQLIDGKTGDHLWAERYDRDLIDIFAIQDEISMAIVAALKLKLLPEEKKAIEQHGTTSAEAYNFYLMARQYWATGNHGDSRREERVVRICQRALDVDPNYARALALMALAQVNLRIAFGKDGEDGLAAADRATALDPTLPEPHCVKARHLAEHQRFAEADVEIAKALAIDPDSWEVNKEAARICLLQRRIPEATRYLEAAVSVMETDYHAWLVLLSCYQAQDDRQGRLRAARMMLEQGEKAVVADPSNGGALAAAAGGLAELGDTAGAREHIERGLLLDPDNLNMRYNFACLMVLCFDDADSAIEMLRPALAGARSSEMIIVADCDPDFDRIREDPRFRQMVDDAKRGMARSRPAGPDPALRGHS